MGLELSPLVALHLRERRRGGENGVAVALAERARAGRKGSRRQAVGAIAAAALSAQGSYGSPLPAPQFTRDERTRSRGVQIFPHFAGTKIFLVISFSRVLTPTASDRDRRPPGCVVRARPQGNNRPSKGEVGCPSMCLRPRRFPT